MMQSNHLHHRNSRKFDSIERIKVLMKRLPSFRNVISVFSYHQWIWILIHGLDFLIGLLKVPWWCLCVFHYIQHFLFSIKLDIAIHSRSDGFHELGDHYHLYDEIKIFIGVSKVQKSHCLFTLATLPDLSFDRCTKPETFAGVYSKTSQISGPSNECCSKSGRKA